VHIARLLRLLAAPSLVVVRLQTQCTNFAILGILPLTFSISSSALAFSRLILLCYRLLEYTPVDHLSHVVTRVRNASSPKDAPWHTPDLSSATLCPLPLSLLYTTLSSTRLSPLRESPTFVCLSPRYDSSLTRCPSFLRLLSFIRLLSFCDYLSYMIATRTIKSSKKEEA
jgi:hypothetical protein